MAGLTTHVLDTAQGIPAAGVVIRLVKIPRPTTHLGTIHSGPETPVPLKQGVTNADGRVDPPLLAAPEMQPGVYELWFEVGAYFQSQGIPLTEPPFLDAIPIRFAIADAQSHYHIPLLVSPWAYSTYRGS